MSEKNLQNWADWSAEDAEAEKSEVERLDGSSEMLKLPQGKTMLRVLPPKAGMKSPMPAASQHFIDLPDGKSVSFNCPRVHVKKPCPACEMVDKLRATGNPRDYDKAGSFLPKRRHYANVIDRKNPEKGVQVFAFPKTIYEALVSLRTDGQTGGNFTHPLKGFDVVIEKTGEKKQTEYKVFAARNNSPLSDDADEMDEWLASMHDLGRFMTILPYDEITKKLAGGAQDSAQQLPAPRGRGGAAAGRSVGDDQEV
jgi:gp32 DNA binding protein like